MSIKIGSTIEKLDPNDPYDLMKGSDVGGFDELKTQADATKAVLDPLATTDIPAAKQSIANLEKLVDNSVETIALTKQDQLVITNFKGEKNLVQLPKPGTAPSVELTKLKQEVLTAERELSQAGVDINALKSEFGHIDHQLQALGNVYTYTGQTAPVIPADKTYHSYFLTIRAPDATPIPITMPNPTDGVSDGTLWHLSNNSKTANIILTPIPGDTINSTVSLTVAPGTYLVLIKSGNDWFLVTESSTTAREHPLTAAMISAAVDNGVAPNSGSVKGLADGWWQIPVGNTGISGRPKGSQGDVILYKHSLTTGTKSPFAISLAFGQDNGKDPAMWIQYRDGVSGTWTRWEKLDDGGTGDVSAITSDIAALKAADTGILARLSSLETSLGNIYAPNKAAFDKSSQALIDAALATFKEGLEKAGWGPLTSLPGGDHPLPQGIPKIYGQYGVTFPTAIGSSGQFSSTSGALHMSRASTVANRIFIIVPNDINQADDVSGISIDGGLAARWSSRDLTLSGNPYRVFYSPGGYSEKSNTVQVLFGNMGVM